MFSAWVGTPPSLPWLPASQKVPEMFAQLSGASNHILAPPGSEKWRSYPLPAMRHPTLSWCWAGCGGGGRPAVHTQSITASSGSFVTFTPAAKTGRGCPECSRPRPSPGEEPPCHTWLPLWTPGSLTARVPPRPCPSSPESDLWGQTRIGSFDKLQG